MGHHLNASLEGNRRRWDLPTIGLFFLVTSTGLIGVPLFGYVYGYTKLDWTLAGVLYLISGLGITVGYHRMIAHRSFRSPDWVKVAFLVAGSWAMENSALKWSANHARHHTFPRDYRNGPLWCNVDPSKWLIYMLSRVGLAEGLVRCDSKQRAVDEPRNTVPEGFGILPGSTLKPRE